VKTYRYIYPLSRHFRFRGRERPYPPYEKGEAPIIWQRNRRKIKENIIRLFDRIP
jgi:hypothetical protein